jgi:quinolinate synthase
MSDSVSRITENINRLKKERQALILSHNYQVGEIQDVADFTGDSLELSRMAIRTDAKVILFCGVHFMAETAVLLNPEKMVLIPDLTAGCSMSDMITAEQVREMKVKHPGAVVVCYVNTAAAVKAESDICCTSANAATVVSSIPPDREIIFIPDQYLGNYVAKQTGRKLILYDGYCPVHYRIMAADLKEVKAQHPSAEILVHPECTPDVVAQADQVLSTSGISRAVRGSTAQEIIIGTEVGILHRLKKENPRKQIYAACQWCDCAHMKVNTLEKVLWSLEDLQYIVAVPEEIAVRARRAVERMMAVSA